MANQVNISIQNVQKLVMACGHYTRHNTFR